MNLETIHGALQRVVRQEPAGDLTLAAALQLLDAAAKDRELPIDRHFRHYLEKRSYVKALQALENQD